MCRGFLTLAAHEISLSSFFSQAREIPCFFFPPPFFNRCITKTEKRNKIKKKASRVRFQSLKYYVRIGKLKRWKSFVPSDNNNPKRSKETKPRIFSDHWIPSKGRVTAPTDPKGRTSDPWYREKRGAGEIKWRHVDPLVHDFLLLCIRMPRHYCRAANCWQLRRQQPSPAPRPPPRSGARVQFWWSCRRQISRRIQRVSRPGINLSRMLRFDGRRPSSTNLFPRKIFFFPWNDGWGNNRYICDYRWMFRKKIILSLYNLIFKETVITTKCLVNFLLAEKIVTIPKITYLNNM